MEQPSGFETHDRQTHVCKLNKALYGFKEAPRTWYDKMDSFLMCLGFTKSKAYSNLYFMVDDGRPMILLLYIDDMFLTGEYELIIYTKRRLATKFKMKDLGMIHYFSGLEVWQRSNRIFLGQGKYVVDILKIFRMLEYKAIATPMA